MDEQVHEKYYCYDYVRKKGRQVYPFEQLLHTKSIVEPEPEVIRVTSGRAWLEDAEDRGAQVQGGHFAPQFDGFCRGAE